MVKVVYYNLPSRPFQHNNKPKAKEIWQTTFQTLCSKTLLQNGRQRKPHQRLVIAVLCMQFIFMCYLTLPILESIISLMIDIMLVFKHQLYENMTKCMYQKWHTVPQKRSHFCNKAYKRV